MTITSNNASNIYTVTVPISSTQILNMVAAPILILPPPPSGYVIQPLNGVIINNPNTQPYVGGSNDLALGTTFDLSTVSSIQLVFSSDVFGYLENSQVCSISPINCSTIVADTIVNGLFLFNTSGVEIAGGDGAATVIIDYKLVKISIP